MCWGGVEVVFEVKKLAATHCLRREAPCITQRSERICG
jgi:hypothetical protein